ncbi:hypothetical protein [Pseudoclavibacter soli]|uniref:variant leucine-rich repeat-containing protein n=1 Tax=Pseudoclavibacter soli TaxID=452623 RepID=UPI00042293FF|nr:hypothetical protein [Pseudoclavibacter soli]
MTEQPHPNQPVDALLAQVRELTTTPAQSQQIATHAPEHPELIAPLLAHPNIYPQLAQWLRGLQPEQDQKRGYLAGPAATGIAASAATTTGLAATQAGTGVTAAGGTDLAGQIASGTSPRIPQRRRPTRATQNRTRHRLRSRIHRAECRVLRHARGCRAA